MKMTSTSPQPGAAGAFLLAGWQAAVTASVVKKGRKVLKSMMAVFGSMFCE